MTVLVAGDWHLSPRSAPLHGRLAAAFLARAAAAGAQVVLNGDVLDELSAGAARARAAHPTVLSAIEALAAGGKLVRLRGNHDPDAAGAERAVLDLPGIGRVLVEHGHRADPLHASLLGSVGDAITRRFGRLAIVREAARLAEGTARALAGERMVALYRRRCLARVEAERCDLGVFGHVHVPHVAAGDRYANAGGLLGETLSYVELAPAGARLVLLRASDLRGRERIAPEMG